MGRLTLRGGQNQRKWSALLCAVAKITGDLRKGQYQTFGDRAAEDIQQTEALIEQIEKKM